MQNLKQLNFETEENFYPLDEKIFLNSGIAMFESQISKLSKSSPDYSLLSSIPEKYYIFSGASDNYLYPFICLSTPPLKKLPVGSVVLRLLMASCFESEHIQNLDIVNLPYPGYHPGTKNDEIHSDVNAQMFLAPDIESLTNEELSNYIEVELGWDSPDDLIKSGYDPIDYLKGIRDSYQYHKTLREFVLDKHLYYVLIHTKPKKHEDFEFSDHVILFAVGVSHNSGNLIGVIGHQTCHNFCD